jgi:hypothetical protein
MSNSLLNKNLASLKKKDPALFEKIASLKSSKFYVVTKSRSGPPALVHIDSEGNKKQINSNYDPVGEASRSLDNSTISESINFIVLGLGLSYQVLEIIRQTSKQAKIYIFEKDPELFALAIREVDFSLIFEHPGVKLFIDADPSEFNELIEPERINFTLNEYCLVRQKALIDRNLKYYKALLEELEKYFKESRINIKTQSVHSKLYYKNIFSNFETLITSPGITSLKECLPDVPAIICSAGPSLDKNIQLLKSARERFFLIAVATALKPLLHDGIRPDIVISIDPDELTIKAYDLLNDTGDTWLAYNPAVPNAIPKAFPNRRVAFDSEVYLAEWLKKHSEEKGNLGKITSVAHSAFKFAQHLACSPIILVGQDLSFHKQRLHCLHSFYYDDSMHLVNRGNPFSYLNCLKYLNFAPNLIDCTDLFGCRVSSSLAMESYNHIFAQSFETSQTIINATEGGVPIKGMRNLPLKEALHNYCKKSVRRNCDSWISPIPKNKDSLNSLRDSTLSQIQNLKDISEKLNAIKSKYSEMSMTDNKQLFINEMESVYKNVLEYEETALLLQGYDFTGFSNWYCSNSQILSKKELSKDNCLLDEEFDRDLKFLDVLANSVEYLRVNFEKSLSP